MSKNKKEKISNIEDIKADSDLNGNKDIDNNEKNKNYLISIKSNYILKNIFSFIKENLKLNILEYNKKLQNKLDISIRTYQKISGKYIVGGKNGIVKEYILNKDILIFEGEYLNGKRNGKGKEYNNEGNVIFEGEYKNGKRNGKGKIYGKYGKKLFEGEFLKGIKNGKGKEYNLSFNVLFEGEYLNGKRWNGKKFLYQDNELYKDVLCFEGEVVKGEIKGKGKEYYSDGNLSFEGEYLNGYRWNGRGYNKYGILTLELKDGKGKGEIFLQKVTYEGGFLDGKKNGKGKEYYENFLIFEGEYLNGEKNGKGKEYLKIGYSKKPILFFEGEYLNGKRWNGKGYDSDGKLDFEVKDGKGRGKEYEFHDFSYKVFEGEYLNGEKNGKGKEYDISKKLIFDGEYLNGKRHGKGKEYSIYNGMFEFEGEYLNGLRNGKGKEYENRKFGKLLYEGEFLNGKKNGKGKEYVYKGYKTEIYEGEFLNGEKNGKGKEYDGKGKVIFEGEYLNGKRWYSFKKFKKKLI